MRPEPGHFYAVGVGPGAPDLLTLRAVRLIEGCDALVAPRSEHSRTSLALGIVRAHLRGQELLEHAYPMTRDRPRTEAAWGEVAAWILPRLEAGRSVVQVTLGDPLIYSTCSYLLEALRPRLDPGRIHLVPGISAMQAAACAFQEDLALQDDRLTLLPATDLAAAARALETSETVAFYKVGDRLDPLIDLLAAKGLLDRARLAFAVEQERQRLVADLRTARGTRLGYLSVVLVRTGRKGWKET
jgi:precorrin-2/cobalt-factor-2 C20-methyltransferase